MATFAAMPLRALSRLQERPLFWLTVIALMPRLLATFCAGGYYAQDDHFLVIEPAQYWLDGTDGRSWLPWNQGTDHPAPTGHMMVYPGLHYLFFLLCRTLGLSDPAWKMVLVRLLHAAWSLIVVRVGYRIAKETAGERIAWRCGLFLALFCYMPFLSVKNLVEMVSAPLVMLSALWLLRTQDVPQRTVKAVLLAGLFAGLAVNIRFQTIFFPAGAGLVLIIQRRWADALRFGTAVLVPIVVLQGGLDLAIWGRPFVEMLEYVRFNLDNPTNTGIHLPWYNYLLLLAGAFVPPLSLAVMFGYARQWRKLILWLPVFAFLLFHSLFPNKQERFMLPILPLFFVIGYCGWETFREASTWWQARPGLWRGVLVWTWSLNVLLLIALTFSYSKQQRVQAMAVLRAHPEVNGIIIEDTAEQDAPMMPSFYWGKLDAVMDTYTDAGQDLRALLEQVPSPARANAVLFIGDMQLPERLARARSAMGELEYVGCGRPGLLDRTLHWLNPLNRNEVILVFVRRDH